MPFKVQDLGIALYESSGNIQIGARSCGGTQPGCTFVPFDHLVGDSRNLDVLAEALRMTLGEIEGRIRSRDERRDAAIRAENSQNP